MARTQSTNYIEYMGVLKYKICFAILLVSAVCSAQEAVHNYGTIQIHDAAMVGFHLDLINNGSFDQNLGLVGFYGDNTSIKVSYESSPNFASL